MSARGGSAIQQALALVQAPRGDRTRPDEDLPEGMLLLIKLVAGEEQASSAAQAATGETAEALREAAGFYIQQVMFAPDSDSYRVLGVDAGAPDERIREHYRWLARWLHPDRNPDAWEVVYADRVNQAWQQLRTPDRRERYDRARAEAQSDDAGDWSGAAPAAAATAAVIVPAPRAGVYSAPPPAQVDLRWLPRAIFLGLGLTAVVVVAIFSAVRWSEPGEEAQLATASESSTVPGSVPAPTVSLPVPPEPIASPQPSIVAATQLPEPVAPAAVAPVALESPPPVAPAPTPAPAEVAKLEPQPQPQRLQPKPVRVPEPESAAVAAAKVDAAAAAREARALARAERAERKAAARQAALQAAAKPASNSAAPTETMASDNAQRQLEASATRIGQADANGLLNHFIRAYERGDLDGMRAMFAPEIRGSHGNREQILADYDRLFGSSSERSLQVRDVSWFSSSDVLTIVASFEASVTSARGGRPRRTRGDLRLDLRREDEQWRIVRLQHGG